MKALFVLLFLLGSAGVYAESSSDLSELTGMKKHEVFGGEICSSDTDVEVEEREVASEQSESAVINEG